MITVHHLNNSRSQRVLWLLEELELPYQVQRYERDPVTMLAPAELKRVHPLGKSPVIEDDGRIVAETGAIIEHLTDKAGGRLVPAAGSADHARYRYWLHYAEGSAMTPLLLKLIFSRMPAGAPALIRGVVRQVARTAEQRLVTGQIADHFDFWNAELAATGWFAGAEFSAADVMMSFPVEAGVARGDAASRPNVKAFLERIQARPAYRRALAAGGPYAYAS
jgi:glutathione S-transferase